ncbi:MAG: MFS transporter [Myxococcota bacterium]
MTEPTLPRRKQLIVASAYYFFVLGALAAFFPYLPLLLRQRQMSVTEVGLILALLPLSRIVGPPIWGWIADTWRVRVYIMRMATLGTAVAVAFLGAILGLLDNRLGDGRHRGVSITPGAHGMAHRQNFAR